MAKLQSTTATKKVTSKSPSTKTTKARKLASLGLVTPNDFLLHLPLRYEDHSQIYSVCQAFFGQTMQFEGYVCDVKVVQIGPRRQLTAIFHDDTGSIRLRWVYFYPNQKKQLETKGLLRIRGEVRGSAQWGFEIIHPKILKAGAELSPHLTPVYPSTQGLSQEDIKSAIYRHLQNHEITEILPPQFLPEGAMSLDAALKYLHHPPLDANLNALENHTHAAWQRIKYDEILAQQLAMARARDYRQALHARAYNVDAAQSLCVLLLERFGYELTGAQKRVLNEIAIDMQQGHPMHRLIQGDVGSGKTVVAALAACIALASGDQVAMMAPTELLAEQHFLKMQAWFQDTEYEPVWLAGSLKASAKKRALEQIANGQARLVIGTQALIQKDVRFQKLGLIITDEQHRFGVGQRLELSRKGEHSDLLSAATQTIPHQLNMSATPIPRTLAMACLADLDVSLIDELPPGRQTIVTKMMNHNRRDEVIRYINAQCQLGRQAYWVCPLIEESEALQLQTAQETHALLQQALPNLHIGLVHGRMHSRDKTEVMQAFQHKALDILVATTVIEVGVDVPNASLMVIEHAERYGLAQLHQLRGRVGRGEAESFCFFLFQEPISQIARERLKIIYESSNGIEIAQRDLELRGPGEFLGMRQSGAAMMRFADPQKDMQIIEEVRKIVPTLLHEYPTIAQEQIERWIALKHDFIRS
ncbi:ATP-dependent DNA helicase RecG [Brackiella oedipodis]|uniref:ATP-dependent DNA helicase RecG n=1 Tax=Brackiella oedipodis TaxID=124225 RepID=UPI000686D1C1|nr:ATP-dependent DNA helicase RecG [Brackiella oedipodis]